jgi:hypothetical protein
LANKGKSNSVAIFYFFQFSHVAPKVMITLFSIFFMLHKSGGPYFFQFSHVAPKVMITLFSIFFYVAQKWRTLFFSIFSHCTKSGGKLQED